MIASSDMARLWTSLSAALVLTGAASEALAQNIDDGLHSVTEIRPGTPLQPEISDAYIRVKKLDGGDTPASVAAFDGTSGGKVHLRANYILVEEGAILSVSNAGWQGVSGAAGTGPGAGGFLAGDNPGGGAGAVGPGGAGSPTPACDGTGGAAGPAHITDLTTLSITNLLMGSSGGASTAEVTGNGGDGGGILILEASLVEINGTVEARGGDSASDLRPGGGGAGGMIMIKALTLMLGDSALISVAGGAGKESAPLLIAGGGGAGGVIVLQIQEPPTDDPRLVVAGGVSQGCPGAGDGAPGAVVELTAPDDCFDLDEDGFAACKPGGDEVDCNDVDPEVNGDATEQCDDLNLDDNCNQLPDYAEEDQEAICNAGGACKAPVVDDAGVITEFASCVPADEIEEEKPPETETVFFGGCGVGVGKPFAALTTLGLAAALLARWRRRKSA